MLVSFHLHTIEFKLIILSNPTCTTKFFNAIINMVVLLYNLVVLVTFNYTPVQLTLLSNQVNFLLQQEAYTCNISYAKHFISM